MKPIQFDLETLGTTAEDKITCATLCVPQSFANNITNDRLEVFYTQNEDETDIDENEVLFYLDQELSTINCWNYKDPVDYKISVNKYDTETEMMIEFQDRVASLDSKIAKNTALTGFNSDSFDLNVLRTRLLMNSADWILTGVESWDLMDTFNFKFNTTQHQLDMGTLNKRPKYKFGKFIGADVNSSMNVAPLTEAIEEHGYTDEQFENYLREEEMDIPTEAHSTLDGIFDLFMDVEIPDPFEDSAEAVTAYEEGRIEDVVLHNVLDVWQTRILTEIAMDYTNIEETRTRTL